MSRVSGDTRARAHNAPASAPAREAEPPALRVVRATDELPLVCHFYAEHQSKHRQVGGRWICDICSPIEEPAS